MKVYDNNQGNNSRYTPFSPAIFQKEFAKGTCAIIANYKITLNDSVIIAICIDPRSEQHNLEQHGY